MSGTSLPFLEGMEEKSPWAPASRRVTCSGLPPRLSGAVGWRSVLPGNKSRGISSLSAVRRGR